jgi:hypothetical protein
MIDIKILLAKVSYEFGKQEGDLRMEAKNHLKGSPEWTVCFAKADAYRHAQNILVREIEKEEKA